MTALNEDFTSYVGVEHTINWIEEGIDRSAQTPTFAYKLPDGTTATKDGSAAYDAGTGDTTYQVVLTSTDTENLVPDIIRYQLIVSSVGVVAQGLWTLQDNYSD